MSTIHLVRHGEVDNPEGILYGRIPGFGLTERGHEMARRVSEHFAEADTQPVALVASPLLRAQQTMAPLSERLGLPVTTDDRVIEAASPTGRSCCGCRRPWPASEPASHLTARRPRPSSSPISFRSGWPGSPAKDAPSSTTRANVNALWPLSRVSHSTRPHWCP